MPLLFPLYDPRGCRRDPHPLTEHSHGENQTRRYDCEPFRTLAREWHRVKRQTEGRRLSRFFPEWRRELLSGTISLLSPGRIEVSPPRTERAWDTGIKGGWDGGRNGESAPAPELRSFNCLLEELIKSISLDFVRHRASGKGQFTRFSPGGRFSARKRKKSDSRERRPRRNDSRLERQNPPPPR